MLWRTGPWVPFAARRAGIGHPGGIRARAAQWRMAAAVIRDTAQPAGPVADQAVRRDLHNTEVAAMTELQWKPVIYLPVSLTVRFDAPVLKGDDPAGWCRS